MTNCGVSIRVRGQDLKCELHPGHAEPHFAPYEQRCPSASIFLEDCNLGLGHEGRHSDGTHAWGYPTDAAVPRKIPNTPGGGHIAATMAAPELADEEAESDPFEVLRNAISFSSMDWGACKDTALIYGIICGWDDDNPLEDEDPHAAFKELAQRFDWSTQKVESIRGLRAEWLRRTAQPVIPAPAESGPWQTWDAVPDAVKYRELGDRDSSGLVWINAGGLRFTQRASGDFELSLVSNADTNELAPFVAAEAHR